MERLIDDKTYKSKRSKKFYASSSEKEDTNKVNLEFIDDIIKDATQRDIQEEKPTKCSTDKSVNNISHELKGMLKKKKEKNDDGNAKSKTRDKSKANKKSEIEEEEEYVPEKKAKTKRKKKAPTSPKKVKKSKAKKTVVKASIEEQMEIVQNYLKETNRPYSSTDIICNLQGKITKKDMTAVLDRLVEEGTVVMKAFKKFFIYVINQQTIPVDQDTLENAKNDLAEIKERVEQEKALNKELKKKLSLSKNGETTDTILNKVKQLRKVIPDIEEKLKQYEKNDLEIVSEEYIKKLYSNIESFDKIVKKRKKIEKEMVDVILESFDKKKADLYEMIGIELYTKTTN